MPRPRRDYAAEYQAAADALAAWLGLGPGTTFKNRTWTEAELDALEVLLGQSVETVDTLDELRRRPKNL